jgi:P-type Na+/K+ transporter
MTTTKKMDSTTVESIDSQSTLVDLPHTMSVAQTIDKLSTDPEFGLTADEAASRLRIHGQNALDDGPSVQPLKILVNQVANAMMLVFFLLPFIIITH